MTTAGTIGPRNPAPDTAGFNLLRSVFLRQLSREEQLLMLLRYAERMDTAEIAEALDLTAEQVELQHTAIVNKLRLAATPAAQAA